MNVWFTSDWHWNHKNSLLFRKQFKDLDEMHMCIYGNFMRLVKPGDKVFFAGDFCLKNTTEVFKSLKLPGDWSFVRGNHDQWKHMSMYPPLKDEVIEGQPVTICHYPMVSHRVSHYGAWQIYGHHHGIFDAAQGKKLNVALEHHNYCPVEWEWVKAYMKGRPDNWDYISPEKRAAQREELKGRESEISDEENMQ